MKTNKFTFMCNRLVILLSFLMFSNILFSQVTSPSDSVKKAVADTVTASPAANSSTEVAKAETDEGKPKDKKGKRTKSSFMLVQISHN